MSRIKYRAKNDIYNAISAGFFSGAVLARKSGPRAMVGGAAAFAAFSAAIDLFLRREPSECVHFPVFAQHTNLLMTSP
jgi:import inner membrane translocase subunit TIM22